MPPRKRGAADRSTRDRLIAAAAEVFAEQGVVAARLEDIAARAGFTRGALYWNFAGKQELLFAVLDSFAAAAAAPVDVAATRLEDQIAKAVRSPAFAQQVRKVWIVAIEFALYGARQSAKVRAGTVKRYEQFWQARLPRLRERLGAAPVTDAELALIARIVQALEDGFMLQYVVDEKRFPIEEWPKALGWVLDGLILQLEAAGDGRPRRV